MNIYLTSHLTLSLNAFKFSAIQFNHFCHVVNKLPPHLMRNYICPTKRRTQAHVELKRYTLFITSRGRYTKIHKCYMSLCVENCLSFSCCSSACSSVDGQPLTCSDIVSPRKNNTSNKQCHLPQGRMEDLRFFSLDKVDWTILRNIGRTLNVGCQGNGWICRLSAAYFDLLVVGFPPSSAFFCFCCIISASLWRKNRLFKVCRTIVVSAFMTINIRWPQIPRHNQSVIVQCNCSCVPLLPSSSRQPIVAPLPFSLFSRFFGILLAC